MVSQALWRPYDRWRADPPPRSVVRAQGSRLTLADGRTLIDGAAGCFDACHGYNHPHIREAVARQLSAMPHVLIKGFTHAPAEGLAERLVDRLFGPLNHVFFGDSAASAVQAAMKMAIAYWDQHGAPERRRFLFIGDGGVPLRTTRPFEEAWAGADESRERLPRAVSMPPPGDDQALRTYEAVLAEQASTLAAVIFEPLIDRSAGLEFRSPQSVSAIIASARAQGVLAIANETFTGFGRMGTMFAFEQSAAIPDILCLSSALTGGLLPLSAAVATDAVFDACASGGGAALMHGPSWTPSPLACAAGCASLDLFAAEPRLDQARSMERKLRNGLREWEALEGVCSLQVKGATAVVQAHLLEHAQPLSEALVDRGVWVRAVGDRLHLAPALNIADEDLSELCSAVGRVLKNRSRPARGS